MRNMTQFQADYLISWDFSETDEPCITVTLLERDGTRVIGNVIGSSTKKSGVVSLHQIATEHFYLKREELEQKKRLEELRKNFKPKSVGEDNELGKMLENNRKDGAER